MQVSVWNTVVQYYATSTTNRDYFYYHHYYHPTLTTLYPSSQSLTTHGFTSVYTV